MKYIGKEMQKSKYSPSRILIVDGYNVINAWPELKKLSQDDLEVAREVLRNYILEFAKMKGYSAYIVFDAYNVKGKIEKIENYHGVEIVFTKENQTADSYIEKFISSLSKYDEVTVATSDYAEQQIVLGKGCSRISARELIEELNQHKKDLRKSNNSKGNSYNSMNRLENRIDSSVLEKLEKIRRNK